MNWSDYQHEVDYATYSPEDDKIRIFSDRVSTELYAAFKKLGWQRAYSQGCFFAKWAPAREDIALELCDAITDEDTSLEERASARSERFATYSENATTRADDARQRSDAISRNIPFGQPILVGHHSEKRHRRDIDRMWALTDKTVQEGRKADCWQRRAEASIRHAANRFDPGVIARRIKGFQARLRKLKRERHSDVTRLRAFSIRACRPGTGYYDPHYGDLDDVAREAVDADVQARIARHERWTDRWIAHLDGQVAYWQTIYNEVKPDDMPDAGEQWPLKKGCWVKSSRYNAWGQVERVNKGRDKTINSVSIDEPTVVGARFFVRKWHYSELSAWSEDKPEVLP